MIVTRCEHGDVFPTAELACDQTMDGISLSSFIESKACVKPTILGHENVLLCTTLLYSFTILALVYRHTHAIHSYTPRPPIINTAYILPSQLCVMY